MKSHNTELVAKGFFITVEQRERLRELKKIGLSPQIVIRQALDDKLPELEAKLLSTRRPQQRP